MKPLTIKLIFFPKHNLLFNKTSQEYVLPFCSCQLGSSLGKVSVTLATLDRKDQRKKLQYNYWLWCIIFYQLYVMPILRYILPGVFCWLTGRPHTLEFKSYLANDGIFTSIWQGVCWNWVCQKVGSQMRLYTFTLLCLSMMHQQPHLGGKLAVKSVDLTSKLTALYKVDKQSYPC